MPAGQPTERLQSILLVLLLLGAGYMFFTACFAPAIPQRRQHAKRRLDCAAAAVADRYSAAFQSSLPYLTSKVHIRVMSCIDVYDPPAHPRAYTETANTILNCCDLSISVCPNQSPSC